MNELDIHNIRLADFNNNFNKTRQSALDVILQKGGRIYYYSNASQKITSKFAKVISRQNHPTEPDDLAISKLAQATIIST